MKTPVTIAFGDGIGPEIMESVLSILDAAKAPLTYETIEIGEKIYKKGLTSGISEESWESIKRTGVFLKSPITTPQGGGYKSLNVTIRKALGLFANIRPCVSYHPFVKSLDPGINCVVVRENEEDLYAGIEYQQSPEVFHAIKLISKPGTEKIIRYAFEYAKAHGRKKVTCLTKDNILKITDGYFHKRFNEIAAEYPEIESEHFIIDIGTARLAVQPQRFDVVVTLNLYGDIISDVVAEVAGSVGMGGSANIGQLASMFEAIHGSAPDLAGLGIANPSGLLQSSLLMLVHLGLGEYATTIYNAWAYTIESGVHTKDIATGKSVTTKEFTKAIISNLGSEPQTLKKASFKNHMFLDKVLRKTTFQSGSKKLEGVDVFVEFKVNDTELLSRKLIKSSEGLFSLKLISNRGLTLWPVKAADTDTVDQWRCRFIGSDPKNIPALIAGIQNNGIEVLKLESLFSFDGQRAYSLAQGE